MQALERRSFPTAGREGQPGEGSGGRPSSSQLPHGNPGDARAKYYRCCPALATYHLVLAVTDRQVDQNAERRGLLDQCGQEAGVLGDVGETAQRGAHNLLVGRFLVLERNLLKSLRCLNSLCPTNIGVGGYSFYLK